MLNVTVSELRSIVKGSNMDGYKNMSQKQLGNLFNKPKRFKIPKPIARPIRGTYPFIKK